MKAVIRAEEFKRLIDNTKRFTGYYSDKMKYIYLEVNAEAKEIKATALDGHRISIECAGVIYADISFNCYCRKDIPKISKRDEKVELELVDGKLFVTVGDFIAGYKQPAGEFYDMSKIINNFNDVPVETSICVDAKLLKDALESTDQLNRTVKIEIRGKKDPIKIIPIKDKKSVKYVLPVSYREEE